MIRDVMIRFIKIKKIKKTAYLSLLVCCEADMCNYKNGVKIEKRGSIQ